MCFQIYFPEARVIAADENLVQFLARQAGLRKFVEPFHVERASAAVYASAQQPEIIINHNVVRRTGCDGVQRVGDVGPEARIVGADNLGRAAVAQTGKALVRKWRAQLPAVSDRRLDQYAAGYAQF